jgi:hypothetical protein
MSGPWGLGAWLMMRPLVAFCLCRALDHASIGCVVLAPRCRGFGMCSPYVVNAAGPDPPRVRPGRPSALAGVRLSETRREWLEFCGLRRFQVSESRGRATVSRIAQHRNWIRTRNDMCSALHCPRGAVSKSFPRCIYEPRDRCTLAQGS